MTATLSFDVDGPAGLACRAGGPWRERLTTVSETRYGLLRGVPRILDVLAEHAVRATFFAPGITVEQAPALFRELLAAGHEIAHHGHAHLPSQNCSPAQQRDEIERGLAALGELLDLRPAGYRSPAWELTPVTLALLGEHGFAYDSSLMGDDRPHPIAGTRLIELPVHWSLDDVPWFAWTPDTGGRLAHPDAVLDAWRREADHAATEQRHLTYTMHPDVIARPHRIDVLRGLLEHLLERGIELVTAEAAADAAQ